MKLTPIAFALGTIFVSSTVFAAADFATADVNADGQVSMEEAAVRIPEMTAEQFKAADADGDGSLSAAEYAAAMGQ